MYVLLEISSKMYNGTTLTLVTSGNTSLGVLNLIYFMSLFFLWNKSDPKHEKQIYVKYIYYRIKQNNETIEIVDF